MRLTSKLPEFTLAMLPAVDKAVRKTAFDIEKAAKQNAPVDTGALRNSIYIVTSKGSDAEASASAATKSNKEVTLFPPIPSVPVGEAVVAVGVEYGRDVEEGTRKMAGRHYLAGAAKSVKPKIRSAMRQAMKAAAKGAATD